MIHMRKCDGCKAQVAEESTSTCCSAHVNVDEFGVSSNPHSFDDEFYCQECLCEGFCKRCQREIPQETRFRIGLYLDTHDSKYKHP